MVLLSSILLTLLVYTEGIQIKLGPETLSASSDQSAQLQDLISILKLYLKARENNNKGESQNISDDNFSRSKEMYVNEYKYGHFRNDGQQQINNLNLYRKPYIASFPVKDHELISQNFLHNNENSYLKKNYEIFNEFSDREKFIENIKEPFTPPSKFQNIRENLPYFTTGDKNINSNNFYTRVNPVEDLISIENSSLAYYPGNGNRGDENSYSPDEHSNEHRHSSFQDAHNQERPKQKYTFSWNPHNSEEEQQPNIRNERPAKLSSDNNQHSELHLLKQSFYPELVKTLPSPYPRNNVKVQQVPENVPNNPIIIKYLQKNDHTQQYPFIHQSRSHLEAQYNLMKSINVNNNIKELQKGGLQAQSHQESIEKEVLEIVIKKALDLAHATNQRPPVIIHRLVTITKHVPIPVIRHGVIHSYQYSPQYSVSNFL